MKKIARVFPRKTRATPDDNLVFFDGPGLFPPEVDEVHISVAFTWDLKKAEWLEKQWRHIAPVKIGGPAFGKPSGEFIPGRYLKSGYIITSRGCINKCWFCNVWKRENGITELPIYDGWILQDDNILCCSREHIESVFEILKRNRTSKQKVELRGIEPKLLETWHVELMIELKPSQIWLAYDEPKEYYEVMRAISLLRWAGFNINPIRCYCLVGYPKDSFEKADKRRRQIIKLGAMPFAMLWRPENGKTNLEWRKFQRMWARPAIIKARTI